MRILHYNPKKKKNRALLDWTLTFGWTTRWQWQRTANELGFMVDKWRSKIGRESTSLSLSLSLSLSKGWGLGKVSSLPLSVVWYLMGLEMKLIDSLSLSLSLSLSQRGGVLEKSHLSLSQLCDTLWVWKWNWLVT